MVSCYHFRLQTAMPRNLEDAIEVILQGASEKDVIRVQFPFNANVRSIKNVWRDQFYSSSDKDLTDLEFHCIFDGFLLEDNATLIGLGIVRGDTILVFSQKDTHQSETSTIKIRRRYAEEISVGLNVLVGEEENCVVLHDAAALSNENFGHCFASTLMKMEKVFQVEVKPIFADYDEDVYQKIRALKDAVLKHVYISGAMLDNDHLKTMMPFFKDTQLNDCVKRVYDILIKVRDRCLKPPDFDNMKETYGTVFVGPERHANITNYLAYPPTVQMSGVSWKTTIRDLIASYREYSNFDIPAGDEDLLFNNTPYSVDERVFDVYIDSLFKLPFLPSNLHFSFQYDILANEDLRCVDDLVSYIEGDEAEGKAKKKKKRKKKGQQNESQETSLNNNQEEIERDSSPTIGSDFNNDLEKTANSHGDGRSNKILLEIENNISKLNVEKTNLENEILSEEKKLQEQKEMKLNVKGLKERNEVLISEITGTEMEISNISDGISSCDSEIHALEMRLKRVKDLKDALSAKRKTKIDKLQLLDEEKRGLAKRINSETSRGGAHENTNNSLNKIEKLKEQLACTNSSLENLIKAKTCKELLDCLNDKSRLS